VYIFRQKSSKPAITKENRLKKNLKNFQKSIDKLKKKLYDTFILILKKGVRRIENILIHIFFITFIFNIFITLYYFYSLLETRIFLHNQGSMLKIKEKNFL